MSRKKSLREYNEELVKALEDFLNHKSKKLKEKNYDFTFACSRIT